MNKIFRVVWNHATQSWVAVSELTKAHKKSGKAQKIIVNSLIAITAGVAGNAALAASYTAGGGKLGDGAKDSNNIVAIGENASARGDGGVSIGHNAGVNNANGNYNTAIGRNARVGDGVNGRVNQSTAIGGGNGATEGAWAKGDQSIAIGGNTRADGNSSIAIGGDDVNRAIEKRISYTNKDGGAKTDTLRQAMKDLTQVELNGYKDTVAGTASISLGMKAQTNDLAIAIGTAAEATKVNTLALGTGAKAGRDNAVAIGGGSNTDKAGTKQSKFTHNSIEYSWAGGTDTLEGDIVSFGSAGYERQLKNVAAGEVSQTSTDAINGSQLYGIVTKMLTHNYLKYAGDDGQGADAASKANIVTQSLDNNKLNILGGANKDKLSDNNIGVNKTADGTLTVKLAKDLTGLDSANIGGVTVNNAGIAMGDKKITGLKAGEAPTDAVNFGQLNAAVTNINNAINNIPNIKYFSVNSTEAGNRDNTGATATDAIAVGPNATATAANSTAMGKGATANGANGVALGTGAVTQGANRGASSIAIGRNAVGGDTSVGTEQASTAVGNEAQARGDGGTAIGSKAQAFVSNSTAIGIGAVAGSKTKVDGSATKNTDIAYGLGAVAIGNDANAAHAGSIAIGTIASGRKVAAYGQFTTVIGAGAQVGSEGNAPEGASQWSAAMGYLAKVGNSQVATAIGPMATIGDGATYGIALGRATINNNAVGSVAIGERSAVAAGLERGVALGAHSQATIGTREGFNPATQKADLAGVNNAAADARANTYAGLSNEALTSTLAAVSIGGTFNGKNNTRQINHLAAGTADTDAVNVAQLRSVNLKIAGNTNGQTASALKAGTAEADKAKADVLLDSQTLKVESSDTTYLTTDATNNTITITPKTAKIGKTDNGSTTYVGTDGKVNVPNADGLATAQDVANAINSAAWNAIAATTSNGENGGTVKSHAVKAGDTVTFEADKNIKISQTDGKFTFATKDAVEFTTVKVGEDKDGKKPVEFKTEAAKEANNNPTANTPTTALNISSTDNKPTQLTGVGSTLNTKPVTTTPNDGTTPAEKPINLVDLNGTTENPVNPNAAATVGDLQNMGWVVSTKEGDYKDVVKNANEVQFVGTGIAKVTGKTENGIRTITVNVDEAAKVQSPVVYTKADGTKLVEEGGKFYEMKPDGTADKDKPEVAKGDVIASLNSGDDSSTAPTTLGNVKSNLPETRNTADATDPNAVKPITTAQTAPADLAKIVNNAATVGDVLNAGWNLQGNGTGVDFVKPYDTVNFVNGKGTTALVSTDDNLTSRVTFNVDAGEITSNSNGSVTGSSSSKPEEIKTLKDNLKAAQDELAQAGTDEAAKKAAQEKIDAAEKAIDEAGLNKVATAQNVADMINKSGFTLKAGKTDGDNTTANDLADGEVINPGDTITMQAGKNMTVKQEKDGTITYATKDDVEFNSVKVGDSTDGKAPVEFKTEAAKPATNNADDKKPTTALNISSGTGDDAKPTQLTGVGSTLNTKPVTTTPNDGTTPAEKPINLVDLNGTTENPVNPNAAATVGDLQNMGWVVSTKDGNGYKDVVKNANQVDFVGKNGVTVTGATGTDGVRTITVEAAQSPVVYTKADGTKLVEEGGKFYEMKPDGTADKDKPEVSKGDVIASLNSGDDKSNEPTTLGNVKSNLPETRNTADATDPAAVKPVTTAQTAPAAEDLAKIVNNAATVGDVLNAGWNLQGNDIGVDFVKPYDTVNFVDGVNTAVSVTTDDNLTSKVQVNVTGLPITYTTADGTPVVKVGDKYFKADKDGKPTADEVKPAETPLLTNLVNPNASNTDAAPNAQTTTPTQLGNVANGASTIAAPKDADGKDLVKANDGNWYKAENVNPNGTVKTDPNNENKPFAPATPAEPVAPTAGLIDFANSNPNNAATVGDLQNMGWVVSTSDNSYTDQVRNANQVDFKGEGLAIVTGKTLENGTREITVSVKTGEVVKSNEFKAPNGDDLVKVGDNYYKADDIDPTTGEAKPGTQPVYTNVNGNVYAADKVKDGKVEEGTPVVNITNSGNGFVTGNQVADAIQIAGWTVGKATQALASDKFKNEDEKVNPNDSVRFADGKGVTVKTATVETTNANGSKETTTVVKFDTDLPLDYNKVTDAQGNELKQANDGKWYKADDVADNGTLKPADNGTLPTAVEAKDIKKEGATLADSNSSNGNNPYQTAIEKAALDNVNVEELIKENPSITPEEILAKVAEEVAKQEQAEKSGAGKDEIKAGTSGVQLNNVGWAVNPDQAVNKDQLDQTVAKSGFFVQQNGKSTIAANEGETDVAKTEKVTPNDVVDFVDGKGTKVKAVTTRDENGVDTTKVSVDVDAGEITANDNGSVTGPAPKALQDKLAEAKKELADLPKDATEEAKKAAADKVAEAQKAINDAPESNKVATAQNVADMINNSGFTLKTSEDGGKKVSGDDEVINPGDVIDMAAGKNLTVKQDANGKITYATADDVEFNSVKVANPNGTTYTDENGKPVVKADDGKFYPADQVENGKVKDPANATPVDDKNVTAKAAPAVEFKAENATPASNNGTDADKQPTTALNIASTDGKPTQLKGVGSVLDTAKVDTAPAGKDGTNKPKIDLVNLGIDPATGKPSEKPLTEDQLNSAATVRDLANMGWVVSTQDGNGYVDTVKNANKVDFKGDGLATVTGETLADGTRQITVSVKTGEVAPTTAKDKDGNDLVKVGDSYYKAGDIDTATGKPKAAATPVAEGDVVTTANNGAGLVTGNQVADAIQAAGFVIGKQTAALTADDYKNEDERVNPDDNVRFADGNNTSVKLATKESVDASGKKVTTTTVKVDVTGMPVQYTTADGTPVTKVGDKFFTVDEKGNPTATEVKPADLVTNVINPAAKPNEKGTPTTLGNVKNNLPQVNDLDATVTMPDGTVVEAAEENITKAPISAQEAADIVNTAGNNAATVSDVLNTGWNLQNNGEAKDFVKPYDSVNFVNGKGTKAVVETDGYTSNVKFDVDAGNLVSNANGSVTGPVTAEMNQALADANAALKAAQDAEKAAPMDPVAQKALKDAEAAQQAAQNAVNNANNQVATAQNVADAINNSGFTLTTSANGGAKLSGNDELINPGKKVDLAAGKNMTVKQDADGKVTYATADDVQFNSVQLGDANGPKITANGDNINVGKADGAPTKITGVAAGDITPTSNDAVNGAQIYALSRGDVPNVQNNVTTTVTNPDGTTTEQTLNGVIVNEAGEFVLKTYNVQGQKEIITNSVVEAIHNMNEQGIKFFHSNDGVAREKVERENDYDSSASGKFATAIGSKSSAEGTNAVAIGYGSVVKGNDSISIGTGNQVNGNNSGAFGDPSIINGNSSYSVGNNNTVATDHTFVLGNNVTRTAANSVFLGTQSGYVEANLNADGSINEVTSTTAGTQALTQQVTGGVVNQYAGGNQGEVVGVVSVGTVGQDANGNTVQQTRRIQNVAPALLSEKSTDAVNGSQLYSVASNFNNRLGDLNNKVNRNNKDLRAGIAGANAAAGLPQVYIPGKSMVAASAGTYKGQSALAVGYSRASDNGKVILKLQGNANTRGDIGGSIGVGYQW